MPCLSLQYSITSVVLSTWELLSLIAGCPAKKGFRYLGSLICISYRTRLQSHFSISVLRQGSVVPSDLTTAVSSGGHPCWKSCPAHASVPLRTNRLTKTTTFAIQSLSRDVGSVLQWTSQQQQKQSCRLHEEIQAFQIVLFSLQELTQKQKEIISQCRLWSSAKCILKYINCLSDKNCSSRRTIPSYLK